MNVLKAPFDRPFAVSSRVGLHNRNQKSEKLLSYRPEKALDVGTGGGMGIVIGNQKADPFDLLCAVLFVAGDDPSLPAVYMGDYGSPYGNEEKGWRLVNGNWCDDWKCIANDGTYDMIAVGDTLYLANWEGVLKFPLVDLDSAISKEKSYPTAY